MKVHLLRNKNRAIKVTTACGTNPYIAGSVRNGRQTYQNIPNEYVVDFATFKATAPEDRCAHCCEAGLIIRNRQRHEQGKPPVLDLFAPHIPEDEQNDHPPPFNTRLLAPPRGGRDDAN